MKQRNFRLVLAALLCALLLLPAVAHADTGPKPSVRVRFTGLGDRLCYATLLSEKSSTGPSSAYDGNPAHAQYQEICDWCVLDEATLRAFVNYTDPAGYYFLQEGWQVSDTEELAWTYYPPNRFKVLLYFPDSGAFFSSEKLETYAFHSYFDADVSAQQLTTSKNQAASDAASAAIEVERNYRYTAEVVSLLVRIVITLAIELLLALLFGLRAKKQFLTVTVVNVVTQVLLNVALFFVNYRSGFLAFTFYYVLLELAVFAIEAVLFCRLLRRNEAKPSRTRIVLYALCANVTSFAAGLALANVIPELF